ANIAQQLLGLVEEELAKENCLSLKDLAVKGGDMMALGLEGKPISDMLGLLLDRVVDGEVPNEKDALLALAASLRK
ncbi:MAG: tRNA nucleotidyltransferase, partial [Clostridia bacterium]|nr:tRNA nucleotidyltransferase [Clostridia bacterium]